MSILLDSHVVLWWIAGSPLIPPKVRRRIDAADRRFVSPISFWEIALLAKRGKVSLSMDAHRWTQMVLDDASLTPAPLSPSAAVSAALLPEAFPGDPADRMLYATARDLGVPLVTRDRAIRSYARAARDVRAIW